MGSQMIRDGSLRRYVTCPVCNVSFHPGQVKRTITSFTCPECGELLQYKLDGSLTSGFSYVYMVFRSSVLLGYRNLKLILVAGRRSTLDVLVRSSNSIS